MSADDAKSTATARTTKTRKSVKAEEEEEVKPAQEEDGGWKAFLWNSEKKELLGRSGKSWLDITIFYIIFFLALYCFFMLSWYISLAFVDANKPYKIGEDALLYRNGPGLSFRPAPDRDTNGMSTLIWFSTGSKAEFNRWSNQLNNWMANVPNKGKSVQECSESVNASAKVSCFVDTSVYGPCNGASDNTYGYARAEPCILLKLNRIYNWKPEPLGQEELMKDAPPLYKDYVATYYKERRLYIFCEGENDHDNENLGSIEYYPGPYIETKYFPFVNQVNYQTPFIMMQLKRPLPGALVSIVCRGYVKSPDKYNWNPHKESGVMYSRFQVLIGG